MSVAAGPDDGSVLAVRGLTVRYRETLALSDVELQLGAGTVCALLGVNGSGKSTLFKAVMGLVVAERGSVEVFGSPPAAARRRGAIAYLPQSTAVDWDFPIRVRDVVAMGRYGKMGWLRRASRTDVAACDDALARVGLDDLADRQVGALSGGQRQRVFLARALAQEARLLLLDEPFAGVDAGSQATIAALLRAQRERGVTTLLATHDLGGVGELCDSALLLHQSVLAQGDPAEVLTPETLGRVFGRAPEVAEGDRSR